MASKTNVIEVDALSLRYSNGWALHDCYVSVPEGRIAALVGPNGAGKSTFLQILVGLLTPTAGTVRILGEPAPPLARIGFVAQDKPLFNGLTVAEICKAGRMLNAAWDTDYAERRLTAYNIPLDRKVAKLSGGQRTQVALTIALAKLPELLILDEPFADLDPFARGALLSDLTSVTATRKLSVIFSTHVISDLQAVCSWLVVLKHGKVLLSQAIEQVTATHWTITATSRPSLPALPSTSVEIYTSASEGVTKQLIRSQVVPSNQPGLCIRPASLDDVVIGYLAE